MKVKQFEKKQSNQKDESESDGESDTDDNIEIYRKMLALMQPGETVLKAIKRLGGSDKKSTTTKKRVQIWKTKRQTTSEREGIDVPEEAMDAREKRKKMESQSSEDGHEPKRKKIEKASSEHLVSTSSTEKKAGDGGREDLLCLIGLADKLLLRGNMEIYQDTFEKFAFEVKIITETHTVTKSEQSGLKAVDADLDMFSDEPITPASTNSRM